MAFRRRNFLLCGFPLVEVATKNGFSAFLESIWESSYQLQLHLFCANRDTVAQSHFVNWGKIELEAELSREPSQTDPLSISVHMGRPARHGPGTPVTRHSATRVAFMLCHAGPWADIRAQHGKTTIFLCWAGMMARLGRA